VRHPDQIETEVCSKCAVPVAVYPSGQAIMHKRGRLRVQLICSRCVEPLMMARAQLASGAREEKAECVPVRSTKP
jgi:hypothetical protein